MEKAIKQIRMFKENGGRILDTPLADKGMQADREYKDGDKPWKHTAFGALAGAVSGHTAYNIIKGKGGKPHYNTVLGAGVFSGSLLGYIGYNNKKEAHGKKTRKNKRQEKK